MTRRVMPREALEAEHRGGTVNPHPYPWCIGPDEWGLRLSDAEFASAFVDAGLFDAVLTAAREVWTPCDVSELNGPRRGWCMAHNEYLRSDGCSMANLGAALRAYDEGQAQ